MNIRRVKPYEYSFTAAEANDAHDRWGCNCGPTALAAMLGLEPDDVLPHLPKFAERRYTNPSMMQAALRTLGVPYREADDAADRENLNAGGFPILRWPNYGLVRIQWEGPWLKPGVPAAAAYYHTHWVGAITGPDGTMIFDCNGGWFTPAQWEIDVVKVITAETKRATGGWHPTHRWELEMPV